MKKEKRRREFVQLADKLRAEEALYLARERERVERRDMFACDEEAAILEVHYRRIDFLNKQAKEARARIEELEVCVCCV